MVTRHLDPENTRIALLDAGLRLADETGLAGMSVNKVVAAAQSSKGAFFHHFPTRQAYLLALHRRFHDSLLDEVLAAIDGMPPGLARLLRTVELYLDAFLGARGVRGLLIEARSEPLILAEVARRNTQAAQMIEPDLRALDWPEAAASARLVVAIAAEAAIVEYERGGRHEPTRRALVGFLDRDRSSQVPGR